MNAVLAASILFFTLGSSQDIPECTGTTSHAGIDELPEAFAAAVQSPLKTVTAPVELNDAYSLRLNASTFDVPDKTDCDGEPLTNGVRLGTSLDLSWDGDADLNTQLGEPLSLCVDSLTVLAGDYSDRVYNGYNADQAGDCTGPFGQQCVDALVAQMNGGTTEGSDGCPTVNLEIPECAGIHDDSFETSHGVFELGSSSTTQTNGTGSSEGYTQGLSFTGRESPAFSGDNQTSLSVEMSKLELTFLTLVEDAGSSTSRTSLPVCLIAEPKARTKPAAATTTSDDAASPTKMAAGGAVAVAALGFAMGLL